MNCRYLGHSSFIIEFGGKSLIFDPFINDPSIDIASLKGDFLLLSHAHMDHIRDVEKVRENNPDIQIIANYELASFYEKKGYAVHHLNHGGKKTFDFGTVKFVNAIHSSSFSDGTFGGNPGGFVIWNASSCFYFSGDTALTMDMKLIPITCPKLDFAILSLGDNFTMGYEDASIAAQFIECREIIGCHYNTFEVINIDTVKAKEVFSSKNINLHLPAIGDLISL